MNTARNLYLAEVDRHIKESARLIQEHPEQRLAFVYALLGGAIATADSFGICVEDFVREIRKTCPRPPVLVPPKGAQS